MKAQVRQCESIAAQYKRVKEELRAKTIERSQRIVDDWEIAFKPDEQDAFLAWEIWELKRQFNDLENRYLSEGAELIFIGCMAGEHKRCRRQQSNGLLCSCGCHNPKHDSR